MLKCSIFIIVITLFETYNYSKVQCGQFFDFMKKDYHCVLDENAEKIFVVEEEEKAQRIEKIKKDIRDAKDGLSFKKTVKTVIPTSTNLFHYLWNGFKKAVQVIRDLGNIWTRDHGKARLKNEKEEQKIEVLFDKKKQTGEQICTEAFKHQFFTEVKKWTLDADHPDTKKREKLWIRVQTEYNTKDNQDESVQSESKVKGRVQSQSKGEESVQSENEEEIDKKKFWRPAKRCIAIKREPEKGEPNKPFEVYISGAEDFGSRSKLGIKQYKIFIFLKTDWEKLDYWNKWIFFWQRVVHVVGYTWS